MPKNTLYLIASSRPLPEDFVNLQLQMADDFYRSFMEIMHKETGDQEQPPQGTTDAFLFELMKEVSASMSPEKFAALGLSANARGMVYAHGLLPVFRAELGDEEKFRATLGRVEKRSGYKLQWEKCGRLDCMNFRNPEAGNGGALLVVHPDHLALGIYINEPGPLVAHLTGEKRVAAPYSHADLQEFISANGYTGYGEGFIKLREAMDVIQPVMVGMMNLQGQQAEVAQAENCMAVAKDVLDNVPEINIGTRSIREKAIHAELLLKMRPELTGIMKTLPASLGKMPVAQKPVFDLGLSMNIPAVRDNLLNFMTWLGEEGKRRGCAAIDADKLNEASVGIAMATGMGLTQVRALYLALNDIAIDKSTMQPSRLDARASIVADDPIGLVRMAGMLAPPLAQLQMPKDGETITLGPDVLPPGTPPLAIGLEGKRLDIATAGSDSMTKMLPTDRPALLWSSIDGPRYYGLLGELATMAPPSPDRPDAELGIELMEMMSRMQPSVIQAIYPDDRGMVFDLQLLYP